MGGAGFEPAKAVPSDLQSDPFDRSGNPPFHSGPILASVIANQLTVQHVAPINHGAVPRLGPIPLDLSDSAALRPRTETFKKSF